MFAPEDATAASTTGRSVTKYCFHYVKQGSVFNVRVKVELHTHGIASVFVISKVQMSTGAQKNDNDGAAEEKHEHQQKEF